MANSPDTQNQPLEHYSFERYDRVLSKARAAGDTIYSAAYIMPSGGRDLGYDRKHRNHLTLLERMIADSLPDKIANCRGMQSAFDLLKEYQTIGDFLAYQYVTDLNYSELTDFSESDFVVPGPGALDGIRKVFVDIGGLNEPEVIKFMADRQDREFERLGLRFQSLWGRPLMLIDCQNLFCEVDKPFLTLFSNRDPVTRGGHRIWQDRVLGARGQPHAVTRGAGHFLQEDKGEEVAQALVAFVRAGAPAA